MEQSEETLTYIVSFILITLTEKINKKIKEM